MSPQNRTRRMQRPSTDKKRSMAARAETARRKQARAMKHLGQLESRGLATFAASLNCGVIGG
jgi:hypothetical protein